MIEIGRVCTKIAGRDAGMRCIIVDIIDRNYSLVDGETRRRKCNNDHLDFTDRVFKISKGASHDKVKELFKKELNIEIKDSVKKEAKPQEKKKGKGKAAAETTAEKGKAKADKKKK